MYKLLFILAAGISLHVNAQNVSRPVVLFGKCNTDSLNRLPHSEWYSPGYASYKISPAILRELKAVSTGDIRIEIFFGSWCGDSKREVPRFMKLLDEMDFPDSRVSLVGVGNSDSLLKQSPAHEEAGKGIFRVPTIIIYRKGTEINRINEFPAYSLEKDLLEILTTKPYEPNYHSFATARKWLNDGTFSDENISSRSLSGQLEKLVKSEHELNSLGYLLLKQGKKKEALRIFEINYYLFPESANVVSSLGEGHLENGDHKKAVTWLEKALELNKRTQDVRGILDLLYSAKIESIK
jgi:tetratricopeptide (TPR) repeat protein